ncbi:hypothetical protein VMCG_06467 [Cytospora schulzeri]|uniref:Uncharacterized protein n=1 Tax=Cytospora schulzeri TaxID=448051 RepID=A0A423WBU3_9PEZI|nr:hypothetical protein VMCG_06467 [Valsa malicola]
MNWTEGTLNRHSRGRKGKETILRQKEHFAKARSGLLNANFQNSPPSISFLTHPAVTSSLVRHASLNPAQSSPKRRNDALESSHYFSEDHGKSPDPATIQQQQAGNQTLRQKRHKLLFKGDWVGTGAQKPIEMKFSGPRASPNHAWGARLARHESSRHKLRQLLGVKHENGRSKAIHDDENTAESNVAQVGTQRPLLPSAEAEENEAWRDFVVDPYEVQSSTDFPTFRNAGLSFEGLVSPGVSQMDQTELLRCTNQEESPTRVPLLGSNEVDDDMKDASSAHSQDILLQAGQFGIVGSHDPSEDGQVVPAAEGPGPQVLDKDTAHGFEDSQTGGRKTQGSSTPISEGSGEVSLLVVPSSPSPSSNSSNIACYDILLQRLQKAQPEQSSPEDLTQRPQSAGHQELEEPLPTQGLTHTVQDIRKGTPEDDNDIWRKFVFGGSDENLEQAHEEARKETARNLRPSIAFSSTGDEVSRPDTRSYDDFHQNSTSFSTGPGLGVDRHDFAQDPLQHLATNFSTANSASHVATAGGSSPVLTSESQCSEAAIQTDQATAGSVGSSSMAQTDLIDIPVKPVITESSSTETDQSPTMNQRQPEKQSDSVRFARPKLFMGKKLGPVDERRQIALSTAQIRGRTHIRGRPTRAGDGRANIRKLPNYGSDPIEEFEEDARSNRAQQGSIFGSLETEASF